MGQQRFTEHALTDPSPATSGYDDLIVKLGTKFVGATYDGTNFAAIGQADNAETQTYTRRVYLGQSGVDLTDNPPTLTYIGSVVKSGTVWHVYEVAVTVLNP